jgi:hypothetical protein
MVNGERVWGQGIIRLPFTVYQMLSSLRLAAICLFIQERLYLTNCLAQLLSLFNPDVP